MSDKLSERPEVVYGGHIEYILRQLANDVEARRITLAKVRADKTALEQRVEGLERLALAANRILATGTPGSAWMDWRMRAQGLLGKEFIAATYNEAGNSFSFEEIRADIEDMPRVQAYETEWRPRSGALAAEDDLSKLTTQQKPTEEAMEEV